MRETFGVFGEVVDVRVFLDKGYSFIKCVETVFNISYVLP